MYIMKNKYFKKLLLLFGSMSGLSIILCQIVGSSLVGKGAYPAPFIDFICSILLIFLPILYVWGIIYAINLMIEKKTNIIASIILCVLATIIIWSFYGFTGIVILMFG